MLIIGNCWLPYDALSPLSQCNRSMTSDVKWGQVHISEAQLFVFLFLLNVAKDRTTGALTFMEKLDIIRVSVLLIIFRFELPTHNLCVVTFCHSCWIPLSRVCWALCFLWAWCTSLSTSSTRAWWVLSCLLSTFMFTVSLNQWNLAGFLYSSPGDFRLNVCPSVHLSDVC